MKLTNIFKQAGLAAVLLLSAHVAQAGAPPANFTFGAQVLTGDYAGTMGMGYVDYDPAFITGGTDTLFPEGGGLFDLSLTILGQTFSMGDDDDYPAFPTVTFESYMLTNIDFLVSDMPGDNIVESGVASIGLGSVIDGVGGDTICPVIDNGCYEYYVEAFIEVAKIPEVPVPAALWLFGSGLIGLAGIARKRKAS
jgi:hypothetical protein